jgi:hypothetical protein
MKRKYNYIRIIHRGEDYISVKMGLKEYEIVGNAIHIIEALLNKINN